MVQLTCGNQVLMLQRYALGGAGRTGSVHDTAELLGCRRNGVRGVLLAKLFELLEAEDGDVGVRALEVVDVILLDLVLVIPDDVADLGGIL